MKKSKFYSVALTGSAFLAPLHADVLFTFDEVGGNVVATTSGTISSGWAGNSAAASVTTETSVTNNTLKNEVSGSPRFSSTGPSPWSQPNTLSGVSTTSGVGSGDSFGFSSDVTFYAPAGTVAGAAITPNTTITWTGATFQSLGFDTALSTTPVTLFELNNGQKINAVRTAGVSAIPEPSAMLGLAGLMVGSIFLRRRTRV